MIARCHLPELRGERTVRELAHQANVHETTLGRVERGLMLPPAESIEAMETAYGAPVAAWYDWRPDGSIAVDGAPDGMPPRYLIDREERRVRQVDLDPFRAHPIFHARHPRETNESLCGKPLDAMIWLRTDHALCFARPCRSCFPGGAA